MFELKDRYDLMVIILLYIGAKYDKRIDKFTIEDKEIIDFKFTSEAEEGDCLDSIAREIEKFDIINDFKKCKVRKIYYAIEDEYINYFRIEREVNGRKFISCIPFVFLLK